MMTQQSLWHWSQGDRDSDGEPGAKGSERTDAPTCDGVLNCQEVLGRDDLPIERARSLHAALESHLGPVDVTLTDNRRRMVSITPSSPGGRPEVRLHHMFLQAGEETIEAVSDLVQGRGEHARPILKRYIQRHRDAIDFEPSPAELEQRGQHFHLDEVFESARAHVEKLIDRSPGAEPEVELDEIEITWGRRGRGAKSIRFGSFDFDQRLIRVHPSLDRSWVPRFFIEYIVYHEMLHAVYPPVSEMEKEDADQRRVHTAEFERAERQFPEYEEAQRWERENLDRFLNS